ncbi:MAG: glycoside hydrolase family 3 C-terminal domain-containing protein [Prevotella sp.]|nr:glycoside hydrolase family 3 C-terminal domain-containing protein [Prevotella sp.]
MKRLTIISAAFAVCSFLIPASVSAQMPYQNPNLTAHERAVDLCGRLTLEEKASLMLDASPAIPRLGIREFQWWSEALHGVANMGNVTNFPEPIGMAASFNQDLIYKVFDATSTEARAKWNELQRKGGEVTRFHALSFWTPNVNIFRDPRWGRGQETYGEDPYLTSVLGSAVVCGLQGPESSKYRKLWACAKHYAVHSGPEWSRHTANLIDVSARDLWETYLPAFKVLVEDAKVREVMCAYQRLDDEPCCSSNRLLQDILRNEWGFKYLVVSDCGAVTDIHSSHKTASDAVHSTARATLAGTDVECGFDYAYKSIPDAVKRGLIKESEVDKHVIRLLEGRFDLGEMDDPSLVEWSKIPSSVLESKEHLGIALDMARQSMTLLQNKNNVLPLSRGEKVAVIGPNANDKPMMWGNYNGVPTTTVTVLDGIKAMNKNVTYYQGCDLTDDRIVTDLFDQLSFEGKKGIKGTFWNNTEREGKPVTTEYYTRPFSKTTAGNYQFAPGVNLEDFSAQYETVLKPKKSGEVVINVESVSNFDVYVNGEKKVEHSTWRVTPTRTPIQVEAGKEYKIEIHFSHIHTYGASIKVNIGTESIINYADIIKKLDGINKVVFVGGIAPSLEGEEMPVQIDGFKGGDRTNIELPAVQRNFLKALKSAGKTVVYVNCSGSAIALQPETESCDAILQAWYPGMVGGTAVAEVLYGKYNPGGKLPVTFYKNSEQLPDFENYDMKGRTYRYISDGTALFPFGYGLSYTTFNIGEASLSATSIKAKGSSEIKVTIPVENTGKMDGTEVVQLYVRNPQDPSGPVMQLRGFERVNVKAGQTANAVITLNAKSFEWFDEASNTVRTKEGTYELLYGNSSAKSALKSVTVNVE